MGDQPKVMVDEFVPCRTVACLHFGEAPLFLAKIQRLREAASRKVERKKKKIFSDKGQQIEHSFFQLSILF